MQTRLEREARQGDMVEDSRYGVHVQLSLFYSHILLL